MRTDAYYCNNKDIKIRAIFFKFAITFNFVSMYVLKDNKGRMILNIYVHV